MSVSYARKGLLVVLLALLACLAMVCWCLLWNKKATGDRLDATAALVVDETNTTRKQCLHVGDVRKSVESPPRTSKLAKNGRSVPQNLSLSAESAIVEVAEGQTGSATDAAQQASDMNDVMDAMLNRSEIPTDYAETMVALFRDKTQGDVIRDFAVQHIGLYAETLNMRGKYEADSSESATLRDALWDAAEATRTIVAVAAFRALADMAEFDPHIDASRLDSRLATCVADLTASPAARVMAAQLCGERRVVTAKLALAAIAADRRESEPLRLAAANSARLLAE